MTSLNYKLFQRSLELIPGGVNSPVRAFKSVGGTPIFFKRGEGAYVWDVDNKSYIDYVGSWGPLILGHAHPAVIKNVQNKIKDGLTFGAPTEAEFEMAELLCKLVPSIEQVRLVSSGTEATMSAIRLARGYTGRNRIIKFEGCYHGHEDALLVKAGSGALTLGHPSSAGVSEEVSNGTVVLNYNDIEEAEKIFSKVGREIAAVIVEPIAGNMNLVAPRPKFLSALRELCTKYGSVLIFDEVMTGFRVGLDCAQGLYNIKPDLTTLGKVIGGGMPMAAFGGQREIMQFLAPVGPVYQAGTLSGNPIAVCAGLATLQMIQTPGFYKKLIDSTQKLIDGLSNIANKYKVPFSAQAIGGMFGLYFHRKIPSSYTEVTECDTESFNRFFHAMLEGGIYFAPSSFEAGFVSAAHSDIEISKTLQIAEKIFSTWEK
ncbi:MAG: glutamate-1-semialdehyde-2,1-aminomutase [Nitrosomonadaceae bacterium]|nr:glutamate-1-semialdehyde-2,1-aminomutase [Nitrosomonadaceae bacterium]|tara:strand:- start:526 stop:1812 length:1287 start_codon:yes stop_codon:yes gene_type:complete